MAAHHKRSTGLLAVGSMSFVAVGTGLLAR